MAISFESFEASEAWLGFYKIQCSSQDAPKEQRELCNPITGTLASTGLGTADGDPSTPHARYGVQTQSLVSRYRLALTVPELRPRCRTTRADIFIRLARSPALSSSLSLFPALNPFPPPSQPLTSPAARQSNLGHPAPSRAPAATQHGYISAYASARIGNRDDGSSSREHDRRPRATRE
ncbi:hypothetical protein ROHU_024068 [Labeo rohita]|uniref:Uncharacterized protein n=1 Tax=Labeo rohita TaxID=84645 RepID=A0A498MJL0_LABRO|nr:hypothetical protein ROHU_024068 [Labeo rohita]